MSLSDWRPALGTRVALTKPHPCAGKSGTVHAHLDNGATEVTLDSDEQMYTKIRSPDDFMFIRCEYTISSEFLEEKGWTPTTLARSWRDELMRDSAHRWDWRMLKLVLFGMLLCALGAHDGKVCARYCGHGQGEWKHRQ